ncbi:hypothetical protein ACIO14_10930, partial [Nocardia fluminea]
GIIPQMKAEPGMPARQAVFRRQARVREIIHTLPHAAQVAIRESLDSSDDTQVMAAYGGSDQPTETFKAVPHGQVNG